jgi:anti-anti-sigma factor
VPGVTTVDDELTTPPEVDPLPLLNALDALDAAAAVVDAEGALRYQNQRMQSLLDEGALPFSPVASADRGAPQRLRSLEGGSETFRSIEAGLQALLRGERKRFDVELPSASSASPRRALSATPCAVGGRGGALVCVRDLPPPRAAGPAKPIESFFDTILDHLPVAVFIKEAKGFRLLRVNRRYEEFYRKDRKDLLGKSNYDLLSKQEADYIFSKDREVVEKRQLLDIPEERFDIPGKGELTLHTLKLPLYDDETGEPLYVVGVAEDITARQHAAAARQRELAWLEKQTQLLAVIRELSTPVIPVHEGIVVVPLIGHLDEARSAQMQQILLASIQRYQAGMVLIDLTGVSVIDARVANHLLRAVDAAGLLGARCVLVGLSPEVARTIVELEVDLGHVSTQRDLRAGLVYALAQQGKAIVERPASVGKRSS